MSTVTATTAVFYDHITYTWAGMVTGDTITAQQIPGNCGDRAVQFSGTFAGGTSVSLTGSLIAGGAGTYATLTDPQGNAITKTATGLEQVTELTDWVKPTIASGSADSVTCTLIVSRTKKGGI
jgi:hypothetical protein